MADGATPEEIARAWSSQGRDAKSPLDYRIINGSTEKTQSNQNLEADRMASVVTEQGVSMSAHDSARALGDQAARATEGKLAKVRAAISSIRGLGKKTPPLANPT